MPERNANAERRPIEARDALIRLSKKHRGKWADIYRDVKKKDADALATGDPTPEELGGWRPITLLDPDFPKALLESPRPPFVVYAKGNAALLEGNALLYVCHSEDEASPHPAIDGIVSDLANDGICGIVCWRKEGKGQLETILKAYEAAKAPLIAYLPAACKDPDGVAGRVAAFGGLAIRESFPGSEREMRMDDERIPAALCSGCLALGGMRQSGAHLLLAHAASMGKKIMAVPREVGDPEGAVCVDALANGAMAATNAEEAKCALAGGRRNGK